MTWEEEFDGVRDEDEGSRPGPVQVVGIDGTEPSMAALRYTLEQTYLNGGEVHAVYAYRGLTQDAAEEHARAFAHAAYEKLPPAVRAASTLLVTATEGDPTRVLLAAAQGAGGVVVGAPRALRDSRDLGVTVSACLAVGGLPVTLVPEGWTSTRQTTTYAAPAGARVVV